MSEKKFVIVYSSLVGEIDKPRTDGVLTFTENRNYIRPVMGAKLYKVLPHLFLNCEYSVYIDANITLRVEPEALIGKLTKDIGVFPNPYRNCIYDEAEYCATYNLDDPLVIEQQVLRYMEAEYPKNNGLASCGIIVRRHTPNINKLNERWWAEICRGSSRDQISFPYVFRENIQYFERLDPTFKDNIYFKRTNHANQTERIFKY